MNVAKVRAGITEKTDEMSALLHYKIGIKKLTTWSNAASIRRTLATLSGKLRDDATPDASISSLRKTELKEPIGVDKLHILFNNEIENGDIVPVFKRALLHGNKIAVKDNTGEYSYRQILEGARKLSKQLSAHSHGKRQFNT